MNQTEYMVYFTLPNGEADSTLCFSLAQALAHAEAYRKQEFRFVTIAAENADQVGKMGVDSIKNNILPSGQEYVYKTGRDRGRKSR